MLSHSGGRTASAASCSHAASLVAPHIVVVVPASCARGDSCHDLLLLTDAHALGFAQFLRLRKGDGVAEALFANGGAPLTLFATAARAGHPRLLRIRTDAVQTLLLSEAAGTPVALWVAIHYPEALGTRLLRRSRWLVDGVWLEVVLHFSAAPLAAPHIVVVVPAAGSRRVAGQQLVGLAQAQALGLA